MFASPERSISQTADTGQGTTSLAGAGRSSQTIADRQSSPKAKTEPNKSKSSGLRFSGSRDAIPCRCRAEPVKHCRQAIPAEGASEPNKASRQACAFSGQGTMSLAGAGQSPRTIAEGNFRRKAHPNPTKASRQACAYCRRQFPPTGVIEPNRSKSSDLLFTAVKRSYAISHDSPAHPPQK